MGIALSVCTPGTVAQIFIDGRTLHIKRLVVKFKQRINVPYSHHYKNYKKAYRTSLRYFLAKFEAYRNVLPSLLTSSFCIALVDPGWNDGDYGYQYQVTSERLNWEDSRKECQRLGGDLAHIGIRNLNERG